MKNIYLDKFIGTATDRATAYPVSTNLAEHVLRTLTTFTHYGYTRDTRILDQGLKYTSDLRKDTDDSVEIKLVYNREIEIPTDFSEDLVKLLDARSVGEQSAEWDVLDMSSGVNANGAFEINLYLHVYVVDQNEPGHDPTNVVEFVQCVDNWLVNYPMSTKFRIGIGRMTITPELITNLVNRMGKDRKYMTGVQFKGDVVEVYRITSIQ